MRIGLVGYGVGGRYFHGPFIEAAEKTELVGVVARAQATVAQVRADFPNITIYPSLAAMIEAGVCDAVTITTPPHTRRELVLEAIEAGLHVVADKPFAPDAAGGAALEQAAKDKGVTLSVFHNRRLDADIQTVKKVIDADQLGKVWRVHSRMDQDSYDTVERGENAGLLRDLGSHMVDQMVWLLGSVSSVDAQLDYIDYPEGKTVVSYTIALRHVNGSHSHLSASKVNYIDQREFRVYGDKGSYRSLTTDIQAQDLFAGKRPVNDLEGWGYEPESHWGTLTTSAGAEIIPSAQGRYFDYYNSFAEAVEAGVEPPVTPAQAIETLKIIDAAYLSAETAQVVKI